MAIHGFDPRLNREISRAPFVLSTAQFFGHIDVTRPYWPTGMTSELWEQQPLREIPLNELVGGQHEVSAHWIQHSMEHPYTPDPNHGGAYPLVVRWQGRYWLEDGHHRVTAAKARGWKTIKAHVLVKE